MHAGFWYHVVRDPLKYGKLGRFPKQQGFWEAGFGTGSLKSAAEACMMRAAAADRVLPAGLLNAVVRRSAAVLLAPECLAPLL